MQVPLEANDRELNKLKTALDNLNLGNANPDNVWKMVECINVGAEFVRSGADQPGADADGILERLKSFVKQLNENQLQKIMVLGTCFFNKTSNEFQNAIAWTEGNQALFIHLNGAVAHHNFKSNKVTEKLVIPESVKKFVSTWKQTAQNMIGGYDARDLSDPAKRQRISQQMFMAAKVLSKLSPPPAGNEVPLISTEMIGSIAVPLINYPYAKNYLSEYLSDKDPLNVNAQFSNGLKLMCSFLEKALPKIRESKRSAYARWLFACFFFIQNPENDTNDSSFLFESHLLRNRSMTTQENAKSVARALGNALTVMAVLEVGIFAAVSVGMLAAFQGKVTFDLLLNQFIQFHSVELYCVAIITVALAGIMAVGVSALFDSSKERLVLDKLRLFSKIKDLKTQADKNDLVVDQQFSV